MPEPDMQSVYSTNVNAIGYDAENSELYVEWNSGKISIYSGVPEDVAESVKKAPSVGTAMRDIKAEYRHRYA
jgi:hypothetical protein